ncbi:hypothetical protein J1N35_036374 [Gossypium stocksii]|uniref:Uncharacterized protein n=1 Tax=Gossypium stocksii TaxID=47602 RepID=A0A9D3ZKX0_9ROSI|nr:hypothetical protein J1N35_036374 [Gossypium stocksii]
MLIKLVIYSSLKGDCKLPRMLIGGEAKDYMNYLLSLSLNYLLEVEEAKMETLPNEVKSIIGTVFGCLFEEPKQLPTQSRHHRIHFSTLSASRCLCSEKSSQNI